MSDFSIRGLQEAQRWNARAIANMRPSGELGRQLQVIVSQLQRYEIGITHVDTGSLRASLRMNVSSLTARTFIDTGATNPRSGQRTSVYGAFENARGGGHAFAERTVNEAAPRIVALAISYFGRSLT